MSGQNTDPTLAELRAMLALIPADAVRMSAPATRVGEVVMGTQSASAIVALRNAAPALLDRVERAEAERDELRTQWADVGPVLKAAMDKRDALAQQLAGLRGAAEAHLVESRGASYVCRLCGGHSGLGPARDVQHSERCPLAAAPASAGPVLTEEEREAIGDIVRQYDKEMPHEPRTGVDVVVDAEQADTLRALLARLAPAAGGGR